MPIIRKEFVSNYTEVPNESLQLVGITNEAAAETCFQSNATHTNKAVGSLFSFEQNAIRTNIVFCWLGNIITETTFIGVLFVRLCCSGGGAHEKHKMFQQ